MHFMNVGDMYKHNFIAYLYAYDMIQMENNQLKIWIVA